MYDQIKKLLRRVGFEAHRYSVQASPGAQLARLLAHCGVDVVLDVGANTGQYAKDLRAHGYAGRIVSFEPLRSAHDALEASAHGDVRWQVAPRMALGDSNGEISIHVSGNSISSSILDMLPAHERAAPGSGVVASEAVPLARLDSAAIGYLEGAPVVLLKIDTQGYEDHVLAGARGMLDRVTAIQIELSLVSLYAGQLLWDEMRAKVEDMGFALYAVFPGYVHEVTGQTLQVDGFFLRKALADRSE